MPAISLIPPYGGRIYNAIYAIMAALVVILIILGIVDRKSREKA